MSGLACKVGFNAYAISTKVFCAGSELYCKMPDFDFDLMLDLCITDSGDCLNSVYCRLAQA